MCGVLAQFNWAAALTREGVAWTDVLAVNADTSRTVSLQVKTTWVKTGRLANWLLGNVLLSTAPSEWYVMVKLGRTCTRSLPLLRGSPRSRGRRVMDLSIRTG